MIYLRVSGYLKLGLAGAWRALVQVDDFEFTHAWQHNVTVAMAGTGRQLRFAKPNLHVEFAMKK